MEEDSKREEPSVQTEEKECGSKYPIWVICPKGRIGIEQSRGTRPDAGEQFLLNLGIPKILFEKPDGIRGILLNRRNIPIMLMSIESMLLAVNSNFLVFSVSSDDMMGQSFASLVPTVAAAESAIGVRAFLAGRAHPIQKSFPKPLPVQLLKDRDILNEIDRKSLGNTFKATLDGRIQAIQEESQQFPNPNEVVPPESNEQQRLLRISLRICGTVVESLPMARCAPKCEKTVQALLCRNLNVKSATLPNATSSRRIRLQDDLVTRFHFLVRARFAPTCILKAEIVELIREGLVVLRMVRVGGSLKNKEDE
ncbi:hypothetical protein Ddye_004729 [Dipteronia dyeriana]|uniref:ATP synthase protein MI25 n=1 Tax=Dipteronia dyeriana TaxID=168575 RepID=A0AAE0CP13_9ROSI|nr:hypothetical protein Ddye_004729 [Dipteronia dyeriana]